MISYGQLLSWKTNQFNYDAYVIRRCVATEIRNIANPNLIWLVCILILDEATSSVDMETEQQIQRAIENLAGSRTVIVIAHRLSTIRSADQILVLDKGAIIEQGSYDALIAQGGAFARLCGK